MADIIPHSGEILDLNPRLFAKLDAERKKEQEKCLLRIIRACRRGLLNMSTINPFNLDEEGKREAGATALELLCMKQLSKVFLHHLRENKPIREELLKQWESFVEDTPEKPKRRKRRET